MAMKISHLLAYECEDGLLLEIYGTHNERDDKLADAQAYWENECEHEGKVPCFTVDILVPEDATPADIKRQILRHQSMMTLKSSIFKLLAKLAIVDLLESMLPPEAKEPKNPDSDPPHHVH